MLRHPDLLAVARAFDAASNRLARLADRLDDWQWVTRRDPQAWSVAECIVHLNLTTDAYLPLIDAALAAAAEAPPPQRYRCDPVGWMVARAAGPLPRIAGARRGRVRTQAAFVPGGDASKAATLARFEAGQVQLHQRLRTGERVRFDHARVRSPFPPHPQYSVFATFVILPRHQERHLLQAEDLWTPP
jgi:hypothetical protein